MHELLGRAGVVRQHEVLLDEVDLQVQLVQGDIVPEVAVQSVGLLHQDDAALGTRPFEVLHHLPEAGPSGALGRLHVDEFALDDEALTGRVLTQQLQLGRDREALVSLLFA